MVSIKWELHRLDETSLLYGLVHLLYLHMYAHVCKLIFKLASEIEATLTDLTATVPDIM